MNFIRYEKWLQGGSIGTVTYEAKTKRENLLRNLHRRKKKIIFFIYEVFVKQINKENALLITTPSWRSAIHRAAVVLKPVY
jgi:hypothetical protein